MDLETVVIDFFYKRTFFRQKVAWPGLFFFFKINITDQFQEKLSVQACLHGGDFRNGSGISTTNPFPTASHFSVSLVPSICTFACFGKASVETQILEGSSRSSSSAR